VRETESEVGRLHALCCNVLTPFFLITALLRGCTFLIINTYGLIDSPDRFSELGTTTEVCLGSASGSVLSFKELPGLHDDIDFTLSLSIEDSSEGILQLESLGGVFESFGGMRRV
jgi:hypothetical protein